MTSKIIFKKAFKSYETGAGTFNALLPLDVEFSSGEFIGLVGPSGSGKSTLLNLLSGIDQPSDGQINIGGQNLGEMSESDLADFRGKNIGIVFQFFQLVPTLTVLENVVLAMDLVGEIPKKNRRTRALSLLEKMGLKNHAQKPPSKLSGGEQQRVAIARALANDPPILVADEPTGNLDSENSERITRIFEACAEEGRLVIVATHERGHMDRFSRLITLSDGAVGGDETFREAQYA